MTERISFSPANVLRESVEVDVVRVKVPSKSEPGVFYYVSLTAQCQCKSWMYRNRCSHIKDVLEKLGT